MGVICAVLVLGVALPLAAQGGDLSRISQGDSVRLRIRGGVRVAASLGAWNDDLMLLTVQGLDDAWPVSIYDMESLDLHRARTPREGFRQGTILGAVVGLFAGAAVGLALHSTGVSYDPDGPAQQIITTSLKWAGLGAVLGGLTGGFIGGSHPGVGWVNVELPRR